MPIGHIIYVLKTAIRGPVRTPLGRWSVDNHRQTMLKIQYANEDNCGSCGDSNIDNNSNSNSNIDSNIDSNNQGNRVFDIANDDEVYLFMMGVETVPSRVYTIKRK